MFFLIAGLGNPGKAYRENRHNVGFRTVDRLAERQGISWNRSQFSADTGAGKLAGHRVVLLKPHTFMNRSGAAVAAAARFWKLPPAQVLVVHDDIDLALGRIQVRCGGGHGGHRGIKSIAESLGGPDFHRVRLGVGRPPGLIDAADYVLGSFSRAEQPQVEALVDRACDAVICLLDEGLAAAMNRFNPWKGEPVQDGAG